jgi:hypothetical protein
VAFRPALKTVFTVMMSRAVTQIRYTPVSAALVEEECTILLHMVQNGVECKGGATSTAGYDSALPRTPQQRSQAAASKFAVLPNLNLTLVGCSVVSNLQIWQGTAI